MRIALVTAGTRGDFQPFLALAEGLRASGQSVVLATHTDFEAETRSRGFEFRPYAGSFKAALETELGRNWIESGDSPLRYLKASRAFFHDLHATGLREATDVIAGADAVVFHALVHTVLHAAEKSGIRFAMAGMVPMHSSGIGPVLALPGAPRWSWLRRAFSKWGQKSLSGLTSDLHDAERARLGLPPIGKALWDEYVSRGVPLIHLYSEHLVPRPGDWPPGAHVTGFCFLDETEKPSPELEAFVSSGPPPIYVGFGSMTGWAPEQLASVTHDAIKRVGKRAVVVTGWGGLRGLSSDGRIFVTAQAPHGWLFPRVEAVVHHGGSGTTAAALRAGRPSLVVAFFGDQPFWGSIVHDLGAGPRPLHRKSLTAEKLARAIEETCSRPEYRTGAEAIAAKLASEDGVKAATATLLKAFGA